jgi:D-alanyl-D-alanine carboxypeptidase (penicillin-binding protein 5/6)
MTFLAQCAPESVPIEDKIIQAAQSVNTANPAPTPVKSTVANGLLLNSRNVFLLELNETRDVLLDVKGDERIFPASLTKIMTAVVALENINDLDEFVTLREDIFNSLYSANASMAGFSPGEKVRAIDLLYGLLLPSGAECAVGLAEYAAGSESVFVELMNEKARTLGMSGTHFTNTTGLHDDSHYSTAGNIAALLDYALGNKTFCKIFASKRYSTSPSVLHSDGITFHSTLFSKLKSADFDGGTILGGKTGSTNEAGLCLASLAKKGGMRFILVTCGAKAVSDSLELSPPLSAPGDFDGNRTAELHIDDAFIVYNAIKIADGN